MRSKLWLFAVLLKLVLAQLLLVLLEEAEGGGEEEKDGNRKWSTISVIQIGE